MNALDPDIVAHDDAARSTAPSARASGWSIGNDAPEAFCAGANLFVADGGARPGQLDGRSARWSTQLPVRRSASGTRRVPVVAAPFGLTLGGGAEVVLGCQRVQAAAEIYIGLVEVGVGLIPAGGGCMELAARAAAAPRTTAVRSTVAGAQAVREHRHGQGGDQRRGGARPSAIFRQRDGVSLARETADRRRQGSRRSAWRAPATARRRRAASACTARAGAPRCARRCSNLAGGASDQRARREDRRSSSRASCAAAPCPPARRSPSRRSSSSSARRSCRCAASRRRASACSTCSTNNKPLRN